MKKEYVEVSQPATISGVHTIACSLKPDSPLFPILRTEKFAKCAAEMGVPPAAVKKTDKDDADSDSDSDGDEPFQWLFHVTFTALDPVYGAELCSHTTYTEDSLQGPARFKDVISVDEKGRPAIDWHAFDESVAGFDQNEYSDSEEEEEEGGSKHREEVIRTSGSGDGDGGRAVSDGTAAIAAVPVEAKISVEPVAALGGVPTSAATVGAAAVGTAVASAAAASANTAPMKQAVDPSRPVERKPADDSTSRASTSSSGGSPGRAPSPTHSQVSDDSAKDRPGGGLVGKGESVGRWVKQRVDRLRCPRCLRRTKLRHRRLNHRRLHRHQNRRLRFRRSRLSSGRAPKRLFHSPGAIRAWIDPTSRFLALVARAATPNSTVTPLSDIWHRTPRRSSYALPRRERRARRASWMTTDRCPRGLWIPSGAPRRPALCAGAGRMPPGGLLELTTICFLPRVLEIRRSRACPMLDILPIRFFARARSRNGAARRMWRRSPRHPRFLLASRSSIIRCSPADSRRDARPNRAKPSARGSSAWRMSLSWRSSRNSYLRGSHAKVGLGDRGRTARTRRWRSSRIGSIMLSRAGCRYFPLRLVHLPTPGLPPWMRTCCVGRHGLLGARRRNRNRGSAPGRSALSSPPSPPRRRMRAIPGRGFTPFSSVRASRIPSIARSRRCSSRLSGRRRAVRRNARFRVPQDRRRRSVREWPYLPRAGRGASGTTSTEGRFRGPSCRTARIAFVSV